MATSLEADTVAKDGCYRSVKVTLDDSSNEALLSSFTKNAEQQLLRSMMAASAEERLVDTFATIALAERVAIPFLMERAKAARSRASLPRPAGGKPIAIYLAYACIVESEPTKAQTARYYAKWEDGTYEEQIERANPSIKACLPGLYAMTIPGGGKGYYCNFGAHILV